MSVVSYAVILLIAEAAYVACSLVVDRLKKKRRALEKTQSKR